MLLKLFINFIKLVELYYFPFHSEGYIAYPQLISISFVVNIFLFVNNFLYSEFFNEFPFT